MTVPQAKLQIVKLLSSRKKPFKTGELIEKLGYSTGNFLLTKMIGDNNGEYDGSPHQLALTELIESGRVRYWYNSKLDVVYSTAEQSPPKEICGEKGVAKTQIRFFVELALSEADLPADVAWSTPFESEMIWEVEGEEYGVTLHVDGSHIEISDWDAVVGAGGDRTYFKAKWPFRNRKLLVKKIESSMRTAKKEAKQ